MDKIRTMRYLVLLLSITIFLSGCKLCDDTCGPNQKVYNYSVGGRCSCACDQYHEGTNCSIWKSTKFIGTYSGSLIINDQQIINPISFELTYAQTDSGDMFVNTSIPSPNFVSNWLFLLVDTSSLCVQILSHGIFEPQVNYGVGYLSSDEKRLTLNYQFKLTDSTVGNYSFIGLRQ